MAHASTRLRRCARTASTRFVKPVSRTRCGLGLGPRGLGPLWLGAFAAFAVASLPGCGIPTAPAFPDDDDGFVSAGGEAPSGLQHDPPQPAALYPGDIVTLRMISADTSNIPGLSVDERGMLHVPLAGDIDVAGIPLTEAESRIEEGLRRFDRTVRVTVLITDPAGHQASVIGAVASQGRHVVVPGMRVADLIASAGGPAVSEDGGVSGSLADLRNARLMRDGEAVPISVELAIAGAANHNVRVRPGDYLYVPPQLAGLVSVLGEVRAARVIPHRDGIRLSQVLAMAGGITRDANGGDIHIVRGPTNNPSIFRAAIDHVVAGHHPDPVLAPGDIVYVGSSALADFRDVMTAIAPLISIAGTTAIGLAAGLRAP